MRRNVSEVEQPAFKREVASIRLDLALLRFAWRGARRCIIRISSLACLRETRTADSLRREVASGFSLLNVAATACPE